MYACIPASGGGFFDAVCTLSSTTTIFHDPPLPPTQKNRSPIPRAPARSGSLAALTWTVLYLRVEVNHHPSGARAPLASHPRTTLNVVDTPLNASQAGALLVGTSSCSSHDLMP